MNSQERNAYGKAYRQAHTEEAKEYMKAYYKAHKDQHKASMKVWREAHKEEAKEYMKAYYEAHKEEAIAKKKAWYQAHKDQHKASVKAWREANKEQINAYQKSDVNSQGQTKQSIRQKSRYILKQMHLHIKGYEIHHCFGYEDASKFIYISKALHLKIHQYLRDNNIDADSDHWMQIRDIVNSTYEFTYIKC